MQGSISNSIGRVIEEISIYFFISEDFLEKVHVVPAGSLEEKFFRRCTLDGCSILISDEIQEPKHRDQKAPSSQQRLCGREGRPHTSSSCTVVVPAMTVRIPSILM